VTIGQQTQIGPRLFGRPHVGLVQGYFHCIAAPIAPGAAGFPTGLLEIHKHVTTESDGRFYFHGTVPDTNVVAAPGSVPQIGVDLDGRFLTATTGTVKLTLHYRSCGTFNLRIRPRHVE